MKRLVLAQNYLTAVQHAREQMDMLQRLSTNEAVMRLQPRPVIIFEGDETHFESAGQPDRLRGLRFDEIICSAAIAKQLGEAILRPMLVYRTGKLTIR